jgi:dipeptide/tripeptide permease
MRKYSFKKENRNLTRSENKSFIVGTGGIKGIVSPLCADQYRKTENYVKELKSGELVMVDYDLSIQHLYNW